MLALTAQRPQQLPFLKALCWQNAEIQHFTEDEMLDRYERGWGYRGTLEELTNEERGYIATLAKIKGSWLINEL